MRDALRHTDQAIDFGDGQITETGVTSMRGLVNQSQILALLESVAATDAAQTSQKIEALADYQPDFVSICGAMLDSLHRVAVEQQVPGVLQDQIGDLARIKHIAQTVSPEEVQVMYQSLLVGRKDLPLSHSIKSGFEMLMLRLIAFRPANAMTVRYDAPPAPAPAPAPERLATSSSPADVAQEDTPLAAPTVEQRKTEETVDVLDSIDAQSSLASSDSLESQETAESEPNTLTAESVNGAAVVDEEIETTPPQENTMDASPPVIDEPSYDDVPPWDESLPDSSQNTTAMQSVDAVDNVTAETPAPSTKASGIDPAERLSRMLHDDSNDMDDEESDEEADERAIAETEDPYATAANLVEAVNEKPSLIDKHPDTVAQPALAMPLPEIAHFKDMTMNLWWLVAPRLKLTGLVQNIVMNSCLMDASEQGLRLQVPLEYGHMLNQARYEQIQRELSGFFEVHVPLIIDTLEEVQGVTAEEFAASKRAEALQAAITHLNNHPIVQALASTMGGQVIYDTVKVKA